MRQVGGHDFAKRIRGNIFGGRYIFKEFFLKLCRLYYAFDEMFLGNSGTQNTEI